MISQDLIISLINADAGLTAAERNEILKKVHEPTRFEDLLHGALGAGISLTLAKYMKLSKTSQILLSMAGFGIGRYLLDASRKYDKFIQFDTKTRAYKINS